MVYPLVWCVLVLWCVLFLKVVFPVGCGESPSSNRLGIFFCKILPYPCRGERLATYRGLVRHAAALCSSVVRQWCQDARCSLAVETKATGSGVTVFCFVLFFAVLARVHSHEVTSLFLRGVTLSFFRFSFHSAT